MILRLSASRTTDKWTKTINLLSLYTYRKTERDMHTERQRQSENVSRVKPVINIEFNFASFLNSHPVCLDCNIKSGPIEANAMCEFESKCNEKFDRKIGMKNMRNQAIDSHLYHQKLARQFYFSRISATNFAHKEKKNEVFLRIKWWTFLWQSSSTMCNLCHHSWLALFYVSRQLNKPTTFSRYGTVECC